MATKKAAAAPSGEPKKRTTCKTCNGHGATDLVPMNARNTESHYNKYNTSLKLGVAGGTHMGATCQACGGGGLAK